MPSFFTKPLDKTITEDEMRHRIRSLNLLPIKEKLMTPRRWGGMGWSLAKANHFEEVYRGFLFVYWKYDDCAPNETIDDFWHTHVLMTQKYIEDCYFLWGAYAHHNPSPAPRKWLIKAADTARNGRVLDIGAGNLRDTRHLLVRGFPVDAVDPKKPTRIPNDKHFIFNQSAIEEYDIKPNTYDLINAQFVLPFIKDDAALLTRIKRGLKKSGIFVGQFFGKHDEWVEDPDLHFYTKKEVLRLLERFRIISLVEEKKDFNTMDGKKKYWHTLEFIVKK